MKLTQTTGPNLEGRNKKEERIQPWSLGKGELKCNKFEKRKDREMLHKWRNKLEAEVQINEDEVGKLPEEACRVMIAKMIKNLENKMKKEFNLKAWEKETSNTVS